MQAEQEEQALGRPLQRRNRSYLGWLRCRRCWRGAAAAPPPQRRATPCRACPCFQASNHPHQPALLKTDHARSIRSEWQSFGQAVIFRPMTIQKQPNKRVQNHLDSRLPTVPDRTRGVTPAADGIGDSRVWCCRTPLLPSHVSIFRATSRLTRSLVSASISRKTARLSRNTCAQQPTVFLGPFVDSSGRKASGCAFSQSAWQD